MFGIGIDYLNGWVMAAADGAKKERVEWPPHPDRVFMALAAGWFETGEDPEEQNAMQWLERLPAPEIVASEVEIRHGLKSGLPVTSFVPVNDPALSARLPESNELGKLKDAGLGIVPEFRSKQPRRFPVGIPHHSRVFLVWQTDLPAEYRPPMVRLCRKVAFLGHSASLVQMWVVDDPPSPNLVPVAGIARFRLRVPGPGRLEYLKGRCNKDEVVQHREASAYVAEFDRIRKEVDYERKATIKGLKRVEKKAAEKPFRQKLAAIDKSLAEHRTKLEKFAGRVPLSLRPESGLWQGYGPAVEPAMVSEPQPIFDRNLIVLALAGKRPGLPATLKLIEALRGALLAGCQEPVPEWISGHRPDGSCSLDPHLALLPLPFVEHEHADGRIMGLALALPQTMEPREAGQILDPWLRDDDGLPRRIKLFDGQWLECWIELEVRETPPWNLRAQTWTGPSRLWASVTPVVLDRHFKGKDKWKQAAESVKDACERINLPRPETVLLHPVSLVRGTPYAREFSRMVRKSDGGRMYHCHAMVLFTEPVSGPVIVGAGRFRGYGLLRPMDRKERRDARLVR